MRYQAMTFAALAGITSPAFTPGGNAEMYTKTLFDMREVANGATQASFFSEANTGIRTNLPTPGQLPDPEYFNIGEIHVTPIVVITGAADPQQWNDMDELVRAARGSFVLEIQNKIYGPWPIMEAQGLGGVTGFGVQLDATTTTEAVLQANNGVPGGRGVQIDGSLWLTPKSQFSLRLQWDRALVLSATTFVHVAMRGAIYRAIR